MNTMIIITLIISMVFLISIIIINNTWRTSIYERRAHNIDILRLNMMNIPISEDIITIIDSIIKEIFDRYKIMKLYHKENLYISDKQQYQIIEDVFKSTCSAISDTLINKLTLIYKKEYIDDIIAQRVQMVVLDFVIEVNGSYNDAK